MIVIVGILAAGIVSMIIFDTIYDEILYDSVLVNALNNVDYDEFRDNDTHYERVDREKKYMHL